MMRNHGQSDKYTHTLLGYNSRLDDLQAVVLGLKLRHLVDWNMTRRHFSQLYAELLTSSSVVPRYGGNHVQPLYHTCALCSQQRHRFRHWLEGQGIHTGIHYPIPVHLQAVCASYGYRPGDLPVTEQVEERSCLSPCIPN
jgi:dTDP-4-amino-4,6-dideoxygalactose transaminase